MMRGSMRPRILRLLRRVRRDERGSVVVEFALILPVFFMVIFAIWEFGRIYQTINAITAGAREGARLGAVFEKPWEQHAAIKGRADTVAATMFGVQRSDSVTVVCGEGNCNTVTVTVFLKMQGTTPLLSLLGYPDGLPLRGQAIFRWERAPQL